MHNTKPRLLPLVPKVDPNVVAKLSTLRSTAAPAPAPGATAVEEELVQAVVVATVVSAVVILGSVVDALD